MKKKKKLKVLDAHGQYQRCTDIISAWPISW